MVATSWVLSLFALSSVVLASPTAGLSGTDSTGITHSYSEDHEFKRDEGWISLDERDGESLEDIFDEEPSNITARDTGNMHDRAVSHRRRGLYTSLKGLFKPLTGKGETVKITWYSGNDLKNPSCWANTKWVPTDQHYIAAVTLKGWSTKPKCFDFLELCNGTKCTFVRVIDTCAGCAEDSQHVDLSKSAFKALVPLDVGVKKVRMRRASQPSQWRSDLWGPKK